MTKVKPMKRAFAFLFVMGWFVVGIQGTAGAKEPSPAKPLEMCLATAADFSPVYPTNAFPATSNGVTAAFEIPADETVETLSAVYVAVDVGDAAPPNTEITRAKLAVEPGKRGRFRYTQDGPMPPGQYRLDVFADDRPWQSVEFMVRSPESERPESERSTEWYPLAEGTVWTYEFLMESGRRIKISLPGTEPDADGNLRAKVTLTAAEIDEHGTRIELRRNGQLAFEEWLRLDEGGLSALRRRVAGEQPMVLDPPQTLWPLPPRPMVWKHEAKDGSFQQSCQMWGPLPVDLLGQPTPGYVVLVEQAAPLGPITVERHFVTGIGMVRETMTTTFGGELASRQTLVLTAVP